MTESSKKDAAVPIESEKATLHLAHWPPPLRGGECESAQAKRKVVEHVHLAQRPGDD